MRKHFSTFSFIGLILIMAGTIIGFTFGWVFISALSIPWLGGIFYGTSIAALVMSIITFFFIRSKLFMLITAILGILAGLSGAVIPLIGGILLLIGIYFKK